jgi:hypothetical protein
MPELAPHATQTSQEATQALPRRGAEPNQTETYENLWATDLPNTSGGGGSSEPTQVQSSAPLHSSSEATAMGSSEATAMGSEGAWPSFDDSEKSFSNEVFEAVENREFDEELEDEPARGTDATEVIGNLRDSADPTQHALPKTDLQSYREETAHAFSPPPAKEKFPTQPSLPRPSLVEHTSVLATSLISGAATKPGLSEDEVRKIIREEIQTAIGGWLKNRLQEELDRVIDEIDRE